jgi:hypothetical protein
MQMHPGEYVYVALATPLQRVKVSNDTFADGIPYINLRDEREEIIFRK